jgi:hypothetical protein
MIPSAMEFAPALARPGCSVMTTEYGKSTGVGTEAGLFSKISLAERVGVSVIEIVAERFFTRGLVI